MTSRSWAKRFSDACRGVRIGVLGEASFRVHVPVAVAVVVAGACFQVTPAEWLVLMLCITLVMACELVNSGMEQLAKAVTRERNAFVGAALDISAGGVLIAAMGAVVCGLIIFLPRLLALFEALPARESLR
jgi:diacylglycerol kinase